MKTETHPSPKQESMASISALRVLARAENLLMAFLVVAIFGVVLAAILSRFVFHVSRCGSTLVSQMLAAVPQHLVLSEPVDLLERRESEVRAHLKGLPSDRGASRRTPAAPSSRRAP